MSAPADPGQKHDLLTRELKEALARQAATAEILQIIASSPADTQPVFDAIVQSGLKLFPGALVSVALRYPDKIDAAAVAAPDPARVEAWRRTISRTPLARDYLHGAALLDRRIVDIPDVTDAPVEFAAGAQNFLTSGNRAITIMPMMRGDVAIGALSVVRPAPGPLSSDQLALLKTFAAQAVIAIENTRLLNELRQRTDDLSEALDQQTATSQVLQLILKSPTSVQPVLDAIAERAAHLCEALDANVTLRENESLRYVAHHGGIPTAPPLGGTRPLIREWVAGRVALEGKPIHLRDLQMEAEEFPEGSAMARLNGYRTILAVPMLREGAAIGTIAIRRTEAQLFTDRQVALVESFAAQAVIAIENTRLLNELRQRTDDLSESLEQQTATSEVLRVISRSPGELEPVFQTMLANAVRICEANFGILLRLTDGTFWVEALQNVPPAYAEFMAPGMRPGPDTALGRLMLAKQPVHIPDVAAEKAYLEGDAVRVATAELAGTRSLLAVPMLKESELVGAIVIYRQEVRPFTDKQIELVTNFAAQAVIAIENARLLNEVRQQASQLEAQSAELRTLNQQLEQRVDEQVSEIERMGRLRRFLSPQVADLIVSSGNEKQLESHRREISALFCDLRGFTGFSETSDPEDVMALLREYHKAIGEIIFRHGGTLERFAGDGVMVIFGDPVPLENPALAAVTMALEMRAAISALIEKWRRLGHELGFGIGIAHGYATLGTIGFEGRFDYAAIGTVSNVASRLCDEAQPGQILISPRVLLAVEDAVAVEPISEMSLKGIRRPIQVHNVVAAK